MLLLDEASLLVIGYAGGPVHVAYLESQPGAERLAQSAWLSEAESGSRCAEIFVSFACPPKAAQQTLRSGTTFRPYI